MILFMTSAECQTTLIPDTEFEQALIDLNIDDQLDGSVLTANIVGVAAMDLSNKNIQDLTGIEDFVALYNFNCTSNELVSLDVSSNLNLIYFSCSNNNLTSLTMPEASSVFRELDFNNNSLTHFEMTNYTNVAWIAGFNNQLTSVNLSGSAIEFVISFEDNELTDINIDGAEIRSLRVSNNNLSALDLSEQSDLHSFAANDNPNLECINVSQVQLDNIPNNWDVDATTSYAIDCFTVSTSTISDEPKWLVYPNPSHGLIHLDLDKASEYFRLNLYNSVGKLLHSEKLESTQNHNYQLPESNGLYFIQLINDQGTRTTLKVVKN
jgi:hypothetical protein